MDGSLTIDGKPAFWIGWNYWSRAGGPRMWERFDATVVAAELASMRAAGANVCRSFVLLPSFMPEPPRVDAARLAAFRSFLDLCRQAGVATLPSLLVGHMSGENFDFPGQRGRSPYDDPEVLGWTLSLIDAVVGAARGHAAVAGWVLSNEMPLWGGQAAVSTVVSWARTLVERIRANDPGRPVGTGDGVMNAKGGQNGFDAGALAPVVDWIGPHTYFSDVDAMRHGLQSEALVRSVQGLGRPVVLEEFGGSSTQASERGLAAYLRESLHGTYTVGGAGAIAWCFSDFDLADEGPYRHHAFELGFGSFTADGRPKAAAEEVRRFSALVGSIDRATTSFPAPRAAIVVPSYFHVDYPFSWQDRGRMRLCLLESYALATRAGIEVTLVDETKLGAFDLYLVPSMQKLLEPSWRALADRAKGGATVWVSYFHGDHAFHQGMWWHSFESMTGLRHALPYGVPEGPGARVTIGDAVVEVPADAPFPSAFLPCEAIDAEVVLRDDAGRIALSRRAHGRGAVWFCPFPLEYYLSRRPHVHRDDRAWELYGRVAREAGLGAFAPAARATEHHPHVQARTIRTGAEELLWLINRSDEPARVRLLSARARRVFPEPGTVEGAVALGPKEVVVLVPEAQDGPGQARPST